MKPKNKYSVNIDMKWSVDYVVKAASAAEAKKIAWAKFKSNPPKKLFQILACKEN